MSQFVLLLNGHPQNWKGQSEADEKQIMQGFCAWVDALDEKKQYKDCARLAPKMARVSSANGKIVADGPFTETKELFSGIIQIEAESFEQAVAIAKTCPILAVGEEILVLPHHS